MDSINNIITNTLISCKSAQDRLMPIAWTLQITDITIIHSINNTNIISVSTASGSLCLESHWTLQITDIMLIMAHNINNINNIYTRKRDYKSHHNRKYEDAICEVVVLPIFTRDIASISISLMRMEYDSIRFGKPSKSYQYFIIPTDFVGDVTGVKKEA